MYNKQRVYQVNMSKETVNFLISVMDNLKADPERYAALMHWRAPEFKELLTNLKDEVSSREELPPVVKGQLVYVVERGNMTTCTVEDITADEEEFTVSFYNGKGTKCGAYLPFSQENERWFKRLDDATIKWQKSKNI